MKAWGTFVVACLCCSEEILAYVSPSRFWAHSISHGKQRTRSTDSSTRQWQLFGSTDVQDCLAETRETRRRKIISTLLATCVSASAEPALAAKSVTTAPASSQTSSPFASPDDAAITHKVFFNVRISRQDGTFYSRDDLEDTPENKVFYGRLVVGLFGKNAPTHVERFLSYIPTSTTSNTDDNPLPSYGRSQFTRLDQATGLLMGGYIPSLQLTELSGSAALQFYGRILPAPLWIERAPSLPRISHTDKGLLTHAPLDVTPQFGITTRRDTTGLDGTNTVFGRLLLDESSQEFLSIVQDLPTYGMERPSAADPSQATPLEDAASAIFSAQRNFFRSTAKSFGDSRLDKVYEGKLLRRVEVTQVGLL